MAGEGDAAKTEMTGDSQGQAVDLFAAGRRGRDMRGESFAVEPDAELVERKFGRGRPKGATSIATRQRLELFQRIGGDPLLTSARILAMSLDELQGWLGCTRLEAAQFQQRERFEAMPYVMSKAPVDLNLTKTTTGLHLHFPAPPGAVSAGGGVLALFDQAAALAGDGVIEGVFEDESDDAANSKG